MYLLLLVAANSVLVSCRPGGLIGDSWNLEKNGANQLQLSLRVPRNPQSSQPFSGASWYAHRRRETVDVDLNDAAADTERAVENSAEPAAREQNVGQNEGRRYFGDTARLLAIAGAKPQEVDLSGSYSGRKKRSSQLQLIEEVEEQGTLAPEPVSENEGGRYFGNTARLLAIAGAKPQKVDLSGSYSGRKKRSAQLQLTEEVEEQGTLAPEPVSENEGGRYFGNTARLLAIAGAKPQKVDLSGSYSGRRKRSPELDMHQRAEEGILKQVEQNRFDVSRIFNSQAKPQRDSLSGSDRERRKRSGEENLRGLVSEVAVGAVKIKSRGKYGNVVHKASAGATPSRVVFDSANYGRKKRSNFIPFSEYDQRRVKTLKIEQNDFLALPQRLAKELSETERQKRKFPEGENAGV